MDLNTIAEIARASDGAVNWPEGAAWLAGGTWLFSEPQPHLRRLIDLEAFGWEPLTISEQGLEIASTCKIVRLDALAAPADWQAAAFIYQCLRLFLGAVQVWDDGNRG